MKDLFDCSALVVVHASFSICDILISEIKYAAAMAAIFL
jgi:hypothetical protein